MHPLLLALPVALTSTLLPAAVTALPATGAPTSAAVRPLGPALAPARSGDYVVRPGDTVSGIALRLGVSQAALREANGLDAAGRIRAGARLRVPGGAGSPTAADGASRPAGVYVVRPGDNLSTIGARTGYRVDALRRANGLAPGAIIRPGHRLTLPAGTTSSRVETPTRPGLGAHRSAVARRIAGEARARGVDPALALAVGWQESRFRPDARSHANAIGAMQCLPSTARWMSAKVGRTLDPHDTTDNVTCGVAYLQHLSRWTGDEETALAAYYQGLTSVREKGAYPSTQRYVASVQRHRARFAAGLPGVG